MSVWGRDYILTNNNNNTPTSLKKQPAPTYKYNYFIVNKRQLWYNNTKKEKPMNLTTTIQELNLPKIQKDAYLLLAKSMDEHMPNTLYMDYYELSDQFQHSPDLWESFLDIPEVERFRKAKIAKLAEYAATKALNRLANDQNLQSSDIQALTRLIENSKLLQAQKQNKQVVLTYIPQKGDV